MTGSPMLAHPPAEPRAASTQDDGRGFHLPKITGTAVEALPLSWCTCSIRPPACRAGSGRERRAQPHLGRPRARANASFRGSSGTLRRGATCLQGLMVEEMLAARGIDVSHETVRQRARKFGQSFANQIRRKLPPMLDPLSNAALALSLVRLRRLRQPVRPQAERKAEGQPHGMADDLA